MKNIISILLVIVVVPALAQHRATTFATALRTPSQGYVPYNTQSLTVAAKGSTHFSLPVYSESFADYYFGQDLGLSVAYSRLMAPRWEGLIKIGNVQNTNKWFDGWEKCNITGTNIDLAAKFRIIHSIHFQLAAVGGAALLVHKVDIVPHTPYFLDCPVGVPESFLNQISYIQKNGLYQKSYMPGGIFGIEGAYQFRRHWAIALNISQYFLAQTNDVYYPTPSPSSAEVGLQYQW